MARVCIIYLPGQKHIKSWCQNMVWCLLKANIKKKSLLLLKFLVWNMTPKTCIQPPLYKSMSECFKTSNSVSISVNLPNSKVLMISALSCTRSLVLSLAIPQFSLSRPHSLYDNCRDQADTRWRCKQHMCFQLLCSI